MPKKQNKEFKYQKRAMPMDLTHRRMIIDRWQRNPNPQRPKKQKHTIP